MTGMLRVSVVIEELIIILLCSFDVAGVRFIEELIIILLCSSDVAGVGSN